MAVPCALVTSCAAEFPGEELVKRILGAEELPADVSSGGGARFYPWTIDNKYYSASIHLCVVPNKFLVTGAIAESVQAFLVYFDSATVSGLDSVSSWLPLVEEWLPEVMILVCDRVSDIGVSRQKAQEWCIRHSFELVELNPEEVPDEDDDFPESTGVKRIIQALNANVWSNVVMKNGASYLLRRHPFFNRGKLLQPGKVEGKRERGEQSHVGVRRAPCKPGLEYLGNRLIEFEGHPSITMDGTLWESVPGEADSTKEDTNQGFGFLSALAGASQIIRSGRNEAAEPNPSPAESAESSVDPGGDTTDADAWPVDTVADPMLDVDIQELASLTTGEGDLENFERLFSKLKEMKEKAATLPREQRKLHAEKVAKAFWMAIGGDRDEIDGLSSEEDN